MALTCHSAECEQTVKAMPALTHPRYRVKAANVRMQAEKRTSMLTEWNTQPNREGGNVRQSIVILLSSIHDVSPQKKKKVPKSQSQFIFNAVLFSICTWAALKVDPFTC